MTFGQNRRTKTALLAACAALAIVPATSYAQQNPQRIAYSIPAQDLGTALTELARQSNREIVFSADLTRGKRAPRLSGRMSFEDALGRLLNGSGLRYRINASGSIVIEPSGQVGNGPVANYSPVDDERGKADILVVGSRSQNVDIRRNKDDARPYVVFSGEELRNSGALNIEEFLRTRLTVSGAAPSTTRTTQQQTVGVSTFSAGIDLRGLGPNQTVILIDGRRVPGISFGGTQILQGSINGISPSQVERIEILPTTASGIYGGNATGGVVNIILKRDYRGLDLDLRYGDTFRFDAQQVQFDLNAGTTLENGRTQISGGISYRRQRPLYASDREFQVPGLSRAITNDPNFNVILGIPGSICSAGTVNATTSSAFCNTTKLVLDNGTALGFPLTFIPANYGGFASDNGATFLANAGKGDPRSSYALLQAPTFLSGRFSVKRSFTDRLSAYVDATIEHSRSDTSAGAALQLGIPASANPFLQNIAVLLPLNDVDLIQRSRITTARVNSGLIWRPSTRWSTSIEYSWGVSNVDTFSESASGATAAGIPILRAAALNPASGPIPDLRSLLLINTTSTTPIKTTESGLSLRFAGPLFDLPAGPINVSGLAEYRNIDVPAYVLTAATTGQAAFGFWNPPGSQRILSGYIEARVPLFSEKNARPLFRELELSGSIRHDDYRTRFAGSSIQLPSATGPFPSLTYAEAHLQSTDWTVAARYTPVLGLTFRASYGTGFLPPDLGQILNAMSLGSPITAGSATDPRRGGQLLIGDPLSSPPNMILYNTGGNPNLQPEVSKSLSFGAILEPRFLKGFRVSIDYTAIRKRDEITTPTPQFIIDNELIYPDRIRRGPPIAGDPATWAGPITFLDTTSINLNRSTVRALDANLDYRFGTKLGQLHLYAAATRNLTFKRQALATSTTTNFLGFIDGPLKWIANVGLDWSLGGWRVGWNLQYFDSYDVCGGSLAATNSCTLSPNVRRQGTRTVPHQIYNDLSLGYRVGERARPGSPFRNVEVSLNIQNIFDASPPILAFGQYYSSLGDPRLRRFSLSVRKHF